MGGMKTNDLKTLIVDDESRSIETLSGLLEAFCPGVEVAATFTDPVAAMKAIPDHKPDLIFLDVQMPIVNGIELLKIIGAHRCQVVFISAHREFALDALRLEATDYLLKPVDPDELMAAIEKVRRNAGAGKETLEKMAGKAPNSLYLRIPNQDGFQLVYTSDILRIEADNAYSTLVLQQQRPLTVSKGLGEFEPLLPENAFVRVHKSHIVNLAHLHSYSGLDGGTITLVNGDKIPVSRRKSRLLKDKLDQWSMKLG